MRICSLVLCLAFISCGPGNNNNDQPLQGQIGGIPWKYYYGKGEFISGNLVKITLFEEENNQDPCTIVASNNGYLTMGIPTQRGTFSLPFADQQNTLLFNLPGFDNATLIATSGFVEISAVSAFQVAGYLQAHFDDENNVEGSFILNVCN